MNKTNLYVDISSLLYVKDCNILVVLEYFSRFDTKFNNFKSNYFVNSNKLYLAYENFKLKVKFYNFINLGSYLEFFRLFKYNEYLRNFSKIDYLNSQLNLSLLNVDILRKFKLNLFNGSFILYDFKYSYNDLNTPQICFNISNTNSLFIDLPLNLYLYKFMFFIFKEFFSLSLTIFCYSCFFSFYNLLSSIMAFRCVSLKQIFNYLQGIKFNLSKFIMLNFYKNCIYDSISLYYQSNLHSFIMKSPVSQPVLNLDLLVIKLVSNYFYYIVDKLNWDHDNMLTSAFITL